MTIRDSGKLRFGPPLPHLIHPHVTQNGEEPCLLVAPRLKRTQNPHGTNICLLYEILCVRLITSQNHRIAVESIDIYEAIGIVITWHLKECTFPRNISLVVQCDGQS